MARYPEDFDEDEIDEIEHQRTYQLGKENVRFLTKRLGYRYVDWVHGCHLLESLRRYGDVSRWERKLKRSRDDLLDMALHYSAWLDAMEGMIAQQNPHVWHHPEPMHGSPAEVASILADLRMSVIRKLQRNELFAIGYLQICEQPSEWPLIVLNFEENVEFTALTYSWKNSRIEGDCVNVKIVDHLAEDVLLPERKSKTKRERGRPGLREDVRNAFAYARDQGLIATSDSKASAFHTLAPLVVRNAARRGVVISTPSDEVLRKHTTDLFNELRNAER